MGKSFSGSCLCGAVRYTVVADPVFSGNRHCRDCQRASGGAFAPTFMVPETAVSITGTVTYYEKMADSGHRASRGFCPSCGSQVFGKLEAFPGLLGIRAGTLDDPSGFEPALDFYTSSAPGWDHMNPDLPKFAKAPAVS